MTNFNDFSYNTYRQIIKDIKSTNKYKDFADIEKNQNTIKEFILMRHDIEFSIERAYNLSLLESNLNFCSSYFVQVVNNAYNPFSMPNINMIKEMSKNGHHIGLHYYLNTLLNKEDIKKDICYQIGLLKKMIGVEVDRFSIHRPNSIILKQNINIEGIINTYSEKYFTYVETVTDDSQLYVKYISDSRHNWNYGFPTEEFLKSNKRIQILCHPYSWTNNGYNNLNNFKTLIDEKRNEYINTINSECKHFKEIKDEI